MFLFIDCTIKNKIHAIQWESFLFVVTLLFTQSVLVDEKYNMKSLT